MLALQSLHSEVLEHWNVDYSKHRRRTEGEAARRSRPARPIHGRGGARHTSRTLGKRSGSGGLGSRLHQRLLR